MIQNNPNACEKLEWAWFQQCAMHLCAFLHKILSFLGIFSCVVMILCPTVADRQAEEERQRRQRQPKCVLTALRINLDLTRLHGKWYPVEASESAYTLWLTSLYGKGVKVVAELLNTSRDCVVLNFQPGSENNTLNIQLTHQNKSAAVQAALLADKVHPGASKWVISWPNGEDTLSSIVATGSVNSDTEYDWMLTVDCDVNGTEDPDWAIFSREGGLPTSAITAIKSILNGIAGLKQGPGRRCTSGVNADKEVPSSKS